MSWSDEHDNGGIPCGDSPPRKAQGKPLIAPRTSRRFWRIGIALSLLVAVTDAALGPRFILIGLLIVGPCCALFTAQRAQAAQVGAVAVLLALALALPDGIWDTATQLTLTAAVLIVAIACTWAAGIIGSVTRR
jgi:membrane-bound ClpP family serine protease